VRIIRSVIGVIAAAVIVVPLGIGITRSMEDTPQRDREYACIIATGQRCQATTEAPSAP
jgi:hypothetical protein